MILCDLLHGSAFETYTRHGHSYHFGKAGSTVGWSFTMYEEAWNYGFVHEDQHFINCVLGLGEPLETGEDGKAVLEIILGAYESAGTGREVMLPFTPPEGKRPIDPWLR